MRFSDDNCRFKWAVNKNSAVFLAPCTISYLRRRVCPKQSKRMGCATRSRTTRKNVKTKYCFSKKYIYVILILILFLIPSFPRSAYRRRFKTHFLMLNKFCLIYLVNFNLNFFRIKSIIIENFLFAQISFHWTPLATSFTYFFLWNFTRTFSSISSSVRNSVVVANIVEITIKDGLSKTR